MNYLGAVKVLGDVPCVRCGLGDSCPMSSIKMLFGPDATVDSIGIRILGEASDVVEAAKALGQKIAEALSGRPAVRGHRQDYK